LSNDLRLLLDEAITDPLAEVIEATSSAINVEVVRKIHLRGSDDDSVVRYATKNRRIVVTTEGGMDHRRFPPCTHAGIIVLAGARRHEQFHATLFRRFLLSGRRVEARDAVTFITQNSVRIRDHSGTDRTFEI
jgi:hypothetical protein